jgi:DNA-binding IclR family transcriptional regulator
MSQSAERSFDLLAQVVYSPEPRTSLELATAAGIDKSTAARLLASLVQRGLLARNAAKCYLPGPEFLSMAAASMRTTDITRAAGRIIPTILEEVGETTSLHVVNGMNRVCIMGMETSRAIRRGVAVGEIMPIHEGVTGIVLIAFLPEEQRNQILLHLSGRADRMDIEDAIARARSDGYAHAVGARLPEVGALAAPLLDARGHVRAAIAIAGPAYRWDEEKMAAYADRLVELCSTVPL